MPEFRVKLRRSSTSGSVPSVNDLELGELAVNTYDGKIFTKKDDGQQSIVEVGVGTDLTWTASTRTISSSSGANAVITNATTSDSGLMSSSDKSKLDGIQSGAQVNVGTDLSYVNSTREVQSSTGTNATLPEVIAGGVSGFMTGSDKTKLDGIAAGAQVNVGTDLSYTSATRALASSTGADVTLPLVSSGGSAGLMSGSDKTKLDSIQSNAEININADWNATSGDAQILNKPSIPQDLDDLSDVDTTTPTDGQVLAWDSTNSYWAPADASGGITNLSYASSTRVISSSTGTDATLPEVTAGGDSGLMTGADKSKLDGIETGATADQTAAEILTAIKTVDGATSGLDSDLLDGQHGSHYLDYNNFTNTPTIPTNNNQLTNGAGYITSFDITTQTDPKYLRSDAADTFSGNLTGSSGASISLNSNIGDAGTTAFSSMTGRLEFDHDYSDTARGPNKILLYSESNWISGFAIHNNTTAYYSGGDHKWYKSNSSTSFTEVASLTSSGSLSTSSQGTLFGTSNDGAGSGLDADLLDGIQASSFLRSDANDTATGQITFSYDDDTDNFAQVYIRGTDNHSGIVINPVASKQAHLRFYNNGTQKWQWRVPFQDSSDAEMMLYSWNAANDLYKFNHNGTATFNSGTVWTSVNDGAGSGLDADTVDGIQASNFVRSDVNDTKSGQLAITGSGQYVGNYGYSTLVLQDTSGYPGIDFRSGTKDWLQRMEAGTDMQWVYRNNGNYTEIMELTTGGVLTVNGNTVWHAGNDGSGSGLDADTLDGVSSGSFLRSDADDNASGRITFNGAISSGSSAKLQVNGFQRTGPIMLAQGTTSTTSFNTTNERWLMNNGSHLYASTASDSYNNKIWTDSNDGSGSGLDADLWDGNQFSSYLNQALLTTSSPTFNNVYVNDWFRNNNAGEGLYNQSTARHFYSASSTYWHIDSSNGLVFYDAYNSSAGNSANRKGYIYFDGNGFGLLGSAGSWAVNIPNGTSTVIIGGSASLNHYNSTSSTRLSFGGGNDIDNYFIGTNMENYGGNYTKLDLRWHTGIRMGAQALYGGTRIFNNEDLSTLLFSVGRGDGHTRIESGSLICQGDEEKIILRGTYNPYIRFEENTTDKAYIQWGSSLGELLLVNQEHDRRLVISTASNGLLYYRGIYIYKVWEAGNDGSGSGLDADLLDGIQASSFLRSDANDTATGTLTVRDVKISAGYHLQRSNHHSGHLEGSYNNVGENSAKTNPIYTIGSSYNPNDASLSNMYGIGYTHGNNSYAWNAMSSGSIMGGASGWGLYVAADGDVRIFLDGSTGGITMTSYVYEGASDGRLKTNVKPIENALEKVLSIRGVEYDWVDNITSEYEFYPTLMHDVGVIAQEVQAVQPELVNIAPFNGIYTRKTGWKKIQERLQAEENERASAEGDEPRTIKKAEAKTEFGNLSNEERDELCEDQQFLTVDYKKLSVLLVEAIKEQQEQIQDLQDQINSLMV